MSDIIEDCIKDEGESWVAWQIAQRKANQLRTFWLNAKARRENAEKGILR